MKSHQKFFTEAKEPITSSFSSHHKPTQHSLYGQSLSIKPSSPATKHLTVKVYEAKLIVDVSMFGKMRTYTKVRLGNCTWQTNIDKEAHMNPRWNESKTFDLTNLCKSIKGLDMPLGNFLPRESFEANDWNHSKFPESKHNEEDSKINITVYHSAFLQDIEIGHANISVQELVKAKMTSEWYVLQSKKDIAGSILISFEFDTPELDLISTLPKSVSSNPKSVSTSDSRFINEKFHSKSSSRLQAEPIRPSKLPIFEKTRSVHTSQGQGLYSNYSGKRPESSIVRRLTGFSPSQSADYDHFSSMPHYGETRSSRDPSRINRSYIPKTKTNERALEVVNTLITYESHHEDDGDVFDGRTQFYEQLSNFDKKSDDHNDGRDSDGTNCDVSSEFGDEGVKQMDTHDYSCNYSYDTYKSEGEVQRVLEELKNDNKEIRSKETQLKDNFRSIKTDFEKLSKEKENIRSREHALLLREHCIKNEIKNLTIEFNNLEREHENLKNGAPEIERLKAELEEVKREEEMHKEHTAELEYKVKEMSIFLQRKAQELRQFEQNMYRRLIAKRVMEMQAEEEISELKSENTNRGSFCGNGLSTDRQIDETFGFDEESNLGFALSKLKQQSSSLEKELEAKAKHVEELKKRLRYYEKENLAS